MTAGKYNFTIEQGTTFTRAIDLSDVYLTLDSHIVRLQARPTVSSSTKLLDLSSVNSSGITLNSTTRVVTISLAASITDDLSWSTPAYYDMEVEEPSGRVTRVLEGKVSISNEITR
jgi:hypothetical protein